MATIKYNETEEHVLQGIAKLRQVASCFKMLAEGASYSQHKSGDGVSPGQFMHLERHFNDVAAHFEHAFKNIIKEKL